MAFSFLVFKRQLRTRTMRWTDTDRVLFDKRTIHPRVHCTMCRMFAGIECGPAANESGVVSGRHPKWGRLFSTLYYLKFQKRIFGVRKSRAVTKSEKRNVMKLSNERVARLWESVCAVCASISTIIFHLSVSGMVAWTNRLLRFHSRHRIHRFAQSPTDACKWLNEFSVSRRCRNFLSKMKMSKWHKSLSEWSLQCR